MKTNTVKIKKILKWGSVALVAIGLVVGLVGVILGGINTIDFIFFSLII